MSRWCAFSAGVRPKACPSSIALPTSASGSRGNSGNSAHTACRRATRRALLNCATDATAAVEPEGMHAAHAVNGPRFAHALLTTAELLALLPGTQERRRQHEGDRHGEA